MAAKESTTRTVPAQPSPEPTVFCPHGYGAACAICAVTDELLRTLDRPTFGKVILNYLNR
jgi:hypothetical protein